MAKQTVEMQFLSNAKMILGELRLMNAELHNVRDNTTKMNTAHTSGAARAKNHSSAVRGLALRFVGYNLVLNQVMGAQQKLIQFIQDSVKAYREFEIRLAEISTILGAEQIPLMERLKIGIEDLSISYGQATSDMSKGMYDILSAAFDAENALTLLTTATKASIAGLSDIRTSVDIFTTVLNTYGMQVEQATNVSNILFQSVIRGKFQFEDLEQALGYVVPIAAQAGIEFKELMASLSTATRHGLHLDMASRGLALAIQGIVNPTEKTTKAAEKYGIEVGDLAMRVLGLQGWFTELNEATQQFGKSIIGELIPNMRSLRVAMVLAGDVGITGFNKDLQELAEMGNATEIALNKIMETSQFVSNQLTQQWEKTKRDVGEDWDKLMLDIQRGIIVITDVLRGKEYVSKAGAKYEFISDDTIHNASEYLKITEEIAATEKTRSHLQMAKETLPDPSLLEKIGDFFLGGKEARYPTLFKDIKKTDTDLATLYTTQQKFKDSVGEISGSILDEVDALGNLELTLGNVELAIAELEDELTKTYVYGFKDAAGTMKEASVNADEFTTLTQEQRDTLNGLGESIKGNLAYQYMALIAQRKYVDATHDVSMGLEMAGYAYKEIPDNIQKAIDATREYTKAQEENKNATEQMTAAMRTYQIQLLELQLKGMMRRRGLTRMEEQQIKKIQIAQAQARLEDMKGQKEMLESDVITNQESKALIDDYLLKLQEEQYELKYTYDQQVADLETTISREGEKLQTRYDWWETTNQKIIDNSHNLMDTLNEIMEEPILVTALLEYGVAIDTVIAKVAQFQTMAKGRSLEPFMITKIEPMVGALQSGEERPYFYTSSSGVRKMGYEGDYTMGQLVEFKRGIQYVPETMPAIVHRGETITPAGRESPNGLSIENLTIEVKEIADINDVTKMANILGAVKQAQLSDKRGKSKYRMR